MARYTYGRYTLLLDTLPSVGVPDSWFESRLTRSTIKNETLRALLSAEVSVLKSYHQDQFATIEQAATAITAPIAETPVPQLGGYSDEVNALTHLWALLVQALIEWPPSLTRSLIDLLAAIQKVPTQHIHRGDATDDHEEPLKWENLPYFHMIWADNHWMSPGQIARRCPDAASRARARAVYIKQQDVEAQLVAAQLFTTTKGGGRSALQLPRAFGYLVRTLEWKPGADDRLDDAADDAVADGQLKLDFQVPAAAFWIRHCGRELYGCLRDNEIQRWGERDVTPSPVSFAEPLEHWAFWEKRLREIREEEGEDEVTKKAAGDALGYMKAVTDAPI